jgi:DNA-binding transcriptional MocR family regulator
MGVAPTAHGPNVEALQALAQRYSPKAFFTNTNLHNPTGSSYAPSVAYQILRLAEQFDFRIVEDDIFAGLAPVPCQAIASLDQLKRVAYVGSFSKIISPSLRVGFIACNEDLAQRVLHLKMSSGLTTSELNEQITHAILVEGHHRSHMTRLRHELNVGQQTVCDRLAEAGLEIFHRPLGGLFVWARFPKPVDLRDVTQQAAAKGIMLAPGYLFRPDQQSSTWLRFNVAHSHNPKLYDFLKSVS